MQTDTHWHLRKEFSIGTMLGLLVNLVVLVVFVARMDTRLEWLERQQATDTRISIIETKARVSERNIEALEARTVQALEEIKASLRRIEEMQAREKR